MTSNTIHSDVPIEKLTYEQALKELDSVIDSLENGAVNLEDSVELFSRGQLLVQHCQNLLDKAELKIRKISGESIEDFSEQ
jgi:exodeoxyribonuclease VII small subunit